MCGTCKCELVGVVLGMCAACREAAWVGAPDERISSPEEYFVDRQAFGEYLDAMTPADWVVFYTPTPLTSSRDEYLDDLDDAGWEAIASQEQHDDARAELRREMGHPAESFDDVPF